MNRRSFLGMFGASIATIPVVVATEEDTNKTTVEPIADGGDDRYWEKEIIVVNRGDWKKEGVLIDPDDAPISKLFK